jgi:hypothetical protein
MCKEVAAFRTRPRLGAVPSSADEHFPSAFALTPGAAFCEMRFERSDVGAGDADRAHQLLLADPEPARPVLHRMPVAYVDRGGVAHASLGCRRGFRNDGRPRIRARKGLRCRGMSLSDQESVVHTSIHSQVAACTLPHRGYGACGRANRPVEGRANPPPPKSTAFAEFRRVSPFTIHR